MKTKMSKFLRGVITSLLFLFAMVTIICQIVFSAMNRDGRSISSLIDKDRIVEEVSTDDIDEKEREVIDRYMSDYMNYIFHKRSFPSLQTIDYTGLSEEEQKSTMDMINTLSTRIDLEYREVLSLREANNFFGNGALFLLVNAAVFIAFLSLVIVSSGFKKGVQLFSASLAISSFLSLISYKCIINRLIEGVSDSMKIILNSMFSSEFINRIIRLSCTYLAIGVVVFACISAYDKFIKVRLK